MDSSTAVPSLDTFVTSQVILPLAVFFWVLAQVWKVVSKIYFHLFGSSSSHHWIKRLTLRTFLFSSKF